MIPRPGSCRTTAPEATLNNEMPVSTKIWSGTLKDSEYSFGGFLIPKDRSISGIS